MSERNVLRDRTYHLLCGLPSQHHWSYAFGIPPWSYLCLLVRTISSLLTAMLPGTRKWVTNVPHLDSDIIDLFPFLCAAFLTSSPYSIPI